MWRWVINYEDSVRAVGALQNSEAKVRRTGRRSCQLKSPKSNDKSDSPSFAGVREVGFDNGRLVSAARPP